jgi:hypothetical protein
MLIFSVRQFYAYFPRIVIEVRITPNKLLGYFHLSPNERDVDNIIDALDVNS